MKGTVFLKPLEYNIEVSGEKWCQGDKIKGMLKIKNHSSELLKMPSLKVSLAEGIYKKIKSKEAKAWKSLAETKLEGSFSLEAQQEKSYTFEYTLPENCLITDKNASLYLVFFDKEEWPSGHIELVIEPRPVISQILETIQSFLRFKVVQVKYAKGMVEVKLTPPSSSRELSVIDSLILSLSEVERNLTLSYEFNLRVLDVGAATMQTQKKTREFEQKFTSKQYLQYDSLNQDFLLQSINTVLNEVKPKFL